MSKTIKELEKYLLQYYEDLIFMGKSHDEALSETSSHCMRLTMRTPDILGQAIYTDFSINKTQLSEKQYSKALIVVLQRWTKQAEKAMSPTSDNSKIVINKIANIILSKESDKTIIDPAIGTGSLLLGINAENIIGQDINRRLVDFSTNLFKLNGINVEIKKNDSIEKKLTIKDLNKVEVKFQKGNGTNEKEIDYENIWNNKGLFIFDPPISLKMEKPSTWAGKTGEIFENSSDKYTLSEIIFLVNFLIYSKNDSYCICKMPSSLLTSRQKDLDSLRKYLINNVLITAIKDEAGFIILVCKQCKNLQNKNLYTVNFDDEITEDLLNDVISLNDIEENKYASIKKIDRKLIDSDEISGHIIPLPDIKIDTIKYEKPIFYYNQIVNLEHSLIDKVKEIGDKLIEHELIYLTQEENDKLTELLRKNEELKPIETLIVEEENLIETSEEVENADEENPKGFLHWFEETSESSKLIDSLKAIYPVMEGLEYVVDKFETHMYLTRNVDYKDAKTFFNHIKVLFDNNKICKTKVEIPHNRYNGSMVLEIALEPKEEKFEVDYSYKELVDPKSLLSDNQLKMFELLSDNQKKLYDKLCEHWFNYSENQNLFEDFSYAYLARTFKTFEILGLVINVNSNQMITNKYDEYRPFHPLIDESLEEE